MERRFALKTSIILLIIFLMTVMLFVRADPVFINKYPVTVTLVSPKNNTTFPNGSIRIDFSIADVPREQITYHPSIIFAAWAMVDENHTKRADVHFDLSRPFTPQTYSMELTNLTKGTHSLQVLAGYSESDSIGRHFTELAGSSETIEFLIQETNQKTESIPSSTPQSTKTNPETQNTTPTLQTTPTLSYTPYQSLTPSPSIPELTTYLLIPLLLLVTTAIISIARRKNQAV
jgi:hypothetical protein